MALVEIDLLSVPVFVLGVEASGELRYVAINIAFESLTGLTRDKIVGFEPSGCMPRRVAANMEVGYRRCVAERRPMEYEERRATPIGRRWFRTFLTPELDSRTGAVLRVAGVAVDITEGKELERELERAAIIDELTGIANRRGFMRCAHEARTLVEAESLALGLVLVDLDDFKRINDRHGHLVGDEALREIARRMRGAFPHAEIVARLGGDEFVALVRADGDDELDAAVAHLYAHLNQPLTLGSLTLELGASVGAARWLPGLALRTLIARADARMYAAKTPERPRPLPPAALPTLALLKPDF
ncbi:sensor domain-containing diguanylate cyclase [Aureimonas mangrovi]|uniref:sensor domain-containing diguanylate cyclase n=1 Tax=Aureimonas mangrovi TaxID=2758041 RepID=UPI00163D6D40|nr:sensor domain-containing diguanylate cyclase [Aureimonas mangrovi]